MYPLGCDTSSIKDPGNGSVAITSPGGVITASYTCAVGYAVVGVASRTCQSDGQFSGQEPVCQGEWPSFTLTENKCTLLFDLPSFSETVIDCGSPPHIDDGAFNVTETIFESMAQYGCNEGFTLSGSQSRTCQADGTWSGADPVCVAPAKQNNPSPLIVGVVVGLVVAALIALGISMVIILRRWRQRKGGVNILTSSSGNRSEDFSNTIYSGRKILLRYHSYFIMQIDEHLHTYSGRGTIYSCVFLTIGEVDGRYVGIAETGRSTYVISNDYDEVAGDDAYEMTGIVQPAGIVTSTNSDYDDIVDPRRSSNLVITNPSRMESQHHELPQIYSTMSGSSLVCASPYEEPVETAQVRINALVYIELEQ